VDVCQHNGSDCPLCRDAADELTAFTQEVGSAKRKYHEIPGTGSATKRTCESSAPMQMFENIDLPPIQGVQGDYPVDQFMEAGTSGWSQPPQFFDQDFPTDTDFSNQGPML